MNEYQTLTSEILVPIEWPVEVGRNMITSVVKHAISTHKTGRKVVLTIGDVSALVTNDETGQRYRLERVEEINDEETYRIDLILPVKVLLLVPQPSGCGYEEEQSKKRVPMITSYDHPISQLIVSNPDRHKVLTVAPILEKILELKGISGPEIFKYTLQTTYQINKIKLLNGIVLEKESGQTKSADPSIHTEQLAGDKWNLVFNDRLSPSYYHQFSSKERRKITQRIKSLPNIGYGSYFERFWCNWKNGNPWICYSLILVLIFVLVYLCVLVSSKLCYLFQNF